MNFNFGAFCVDIDVQATQDFYNTYGKTVLEYCDCMNCRNYYVAISTVSSKIRNFFKSIGIDPQKTPEATLWYTDKSGFAHYSLIFHVVGTIIHAIDIYKPFGTTGFQLIPENFYELDNNFKVGFTSKIHLLDKNFPQPCVQVEIITSLPWLLK